MGAAAGIAIGVGTVFSAAGQYQAGETNEAIAEHNAQLGKFRAQDSRRRGRAQTQLIQDQFSKFRESQKVGFATQNVQLESDVVRDMDSEAALLAELEVNQTLNNAALEAWGFEQGAQQSILEGQLAKAAGTFGATGTLLSGIGTAAVAARTPQAPKAAGT